MSFNNLPKVVGVEEELNKRLLEYFKGEKTGWYFVGENRYLLPSRYHQEIENFLYFPVKSDDIWISTFPRSGTTLTQELVWLLMNNFDFETAKKLNLWDRSPFFELNLFFHNETKEMFLEENKGNKFNQDIIEGMSRPGYKVALDLPSPRVIKTHFPLSLLPVGVRKLKNKIIYIARNPLEVMTSFYYLLRLWRTSDYTSDLERFSKLFRQGHVPWAPYLKHIQEAWDHRNDSNVLFLFYEDMIKDLEGTIIKIANFLSVAAPLDKVKELKEHLDIKTFCNNPAVNFESLRDVGVLSKREKSFIRKGEVREKSKELTEEIQKAMIDWLKEYYKTTDLRFPESKKFI